MGHDDFEKVSIMATMKISENRSSYSNYCKTVELSKQDEKIRLAYVAEIISGFQDLENAVFSIPDKLPDLKEYLQDVEAELAKEPVVRSKFVTLGGQTLFEVTLDVFVFHLERRYEVEEKLNKVIAARLSGRGFLPSEYGVEPGARKQR